MNSYSSVVVVVAVAVGRLSLLYMIAPVDKVERLNHSSFLVAIQKALLLLAIATKQPASVAASLVRQKFHSSPVGMIWNSSLFFVGADTQFQGKRSKDQ